MSARLYDPLLLSAKTPPLGSRPLNPPTSPLPALAAARPHADPLPADAAQELASLGSALGANDPLSADSSDEQAGGILDEAFSGTLAPDTAVPSLDSPRTSARNIFQRLLPNGRALGPAERGPALPAGSAGIRLNTASRIGITAFNGFLSILSKLNLELTSQKPGDIRIRKGYSPETQALPRGQPHSIGDLGKYLSAGLPPAVAKDIVDNDRIVELHLCVGMEALQSFAARGFTRTALVDKPIRVGGGGAGGALLFRTESPKTGEVRYALTNILGQDLLIHNELQLRLSGVRSENVLTFDHPAAVDTLIDQALAKVGALPRKTIIGYPGFLKSDLSHRGIRAQDHRTLIKLLGDSPYAALLRMLEAYPENPDIQEALKTLRHRADFQGLLALPSEEVFKKWDNALKMEEFGSFLLSLARRNPGLGARFPALDADTLGFLNRDVNAMRAGRNIQDLVLPSQLFTFLTGDGKKQEVLVSRFLYGDLSGRIAQRMLARGAQDIIHLGNAGGTAPDVQVGELQLPRHIHDQNRALANAGLSNGLLEFLEDTGAAQGRAHIRLGTKHAKVSSALLETKDFIRDLKAKGFAAVEIEAAEIARAVQAAQVQGKPAKLSTAILISDIPGDQDGRTIENMHANESGALYDRSFHFAADAIIAYWGFTGVEVSGDREHRLPEGTSINLKMVSVGQTLKDIKNILSRSYTIARKGRRPASRDAASILAARLLGKTGVENEGHLIFRENLAAYLFNGLSRRQLDAFTQDADDLTHVLTSASARWAHKLGRDLQRPYTDSEVLQHLRKLDVELKEKIRWISSFPSTGHPTRIYLAGGLLQGRLGKNSDLDIIVDIGHDTAQRSLDATVVRQIKTGALDEVIAIPLPQDPALKAFKLFGMGNILDLGDGKAVLEQDDFLLNKYLASRRSTPRAREFTNRWLEGLAEYFLTSKYRTIRSPSVCAAAAHGLSLALQKTIGSLLLSPGIGRMIKQLFSPRGLPPDEPIACSGHAPDTAPNYA